MRGPRGSGGQGELCDLQSPKRSLAQVPPRWRYATAHQKTRLHGPHQRVSTAIWVRAMISAANRQQQTRGRLVAKYKRELGSYGTWQPHRALEHQ